VGTARASQPGTRLLVDPSPMVLVPLSFDGSGSAKVALPLPSHTAFTGRVLDLQVLAPDPSRNRGFVVSNGLEIALCAP
jgi:hypothetical protein